MHTIKGQSVRAALFLLVDRTWIIRIYWISKGVILGYRSE